MNVGNVDKNDFLILPLREEAYLAKHSGQVHFNGTSWSDVTVPYYGERAERLLGVSEAAANDVWAVGTTGHDGEAEILHFNGTAWGHESAPSPGFEGELVSVVAISRTNVWAVGDASGVSPFIEHFDGKRWQVVSHPSPGVSDTLTSIAAVSANNIWAVGFDFDSCSSAIGRAPGQGLLKIFVISRSK
jgi:hypothetical protein